MAGLIRTAHLGRETKADWRRGDGVGDRISLAIERHFRYDLGAIEADTDVRSRHQCAAARLCGSRSRVGEDRKSVGSGKSVSVRLDRGCERIYKKKRIS